VALAYSERTASPVAFVELEAIADASRVPRTVLAAAGLTEQSGRSIIATLSDYYASRHALLVLDNCEHVLDACAELGDSLLRAAPELRILTTSREAFNIPGEHAWSVPPLSLPERDLRSIRESEAISLFTERTRALAPAFVVTDQNASSV